MSAPVEYIPQQIRRPASPDRRDAARGRHVEAGAVAETVLVLLRDARRASTGPEPASAGPALRRSCAAVARERRPIARITTRRSPQALAPAAVSEGALSARPA